MGAVVGGVAANRRLRERMHRAGEKEGFRAVFPPADLCTDNAAMIAGLGTHLFLSGQRDDLGLDAKATARRGRKKSRQES